MAEVRLDSDWEVEGLWKTSGRSVGECHANLNSCLGQKERLRLGCEGGSSREESVCIREADRKEGSHHVRRKVRHLVWWFGQKEMGHSTKGEICM